MSGLCPEDGKLAATSTRSKSAVWCAGRVRLRLGRLSKQHCSNQQLQHSCLAIRAHTGQEGDPLHSAQDAAELQALLLLACFCAHYVFNHSHTSVPKEWALLVAVLSWCTSRLPHATIVPASLCAERGLRARARPRAGESVLVGQNRRPVHHVGVPAKAGERNLRPWHHAMPGHGGHGIMGANLVQPVSEMGPYLASIS